MSGYDAPTAAQAGSIPGIDPRQWVSYGIVAPETPDQKSVVFDKEHGPLVNVTLQPSGVDVVCRLAGWCAGNGEGEYFPFIAGDEVIVVLPEGSETAGPVIVGRLNNAIDIFPEEVSGMKVSDNNFAFRRIRTPYVLETASSFLIRSAKTGAFISINQVGGLTLSNSDKAFLALTPDVIGMQNADADCLLQIDVSKKLINLEAAGSKLQLSGKDTTFYTKGSMYLSASGAPPVGHAVTIEQVVSVVLQILIALGPVTTGAVWTPVQAATAVIAGITTAKTAPITDAVMAAIVSALSGPQPPDPTGKIPGVASHGIFLG